MDGMAPSPRYKDLELDLENGVTVSEEEEEEDYRRSPVSGVKKKAQLWLAQVKGSFGEESDDRVSLSGDASNSGSVYVENSRMNVEGQESKDAKEKRKSLGNKKPPRPPRAPSLDAADQKLIREIAELARLKRARIERMKALKKMKAAAKPTSSNTNIFAMLFTLIFCLVIMFQGMSSGGTPASYQGSPLPAGAVVGGLISVKFSWNPSSSFPNQPDSTSPYLVEQVAGLEAREKLRRFSG